jgi:hypothetical protein
MTRNNNVYKAPVKPAAAVPVKNWSANKPVALVRPEWLSTPLTADQKLELSFQRLISMHTFMRPAHSLTEEAFINKYIDCIVGMNSDSYGNRSMVILKSDGTKPETAFMCHTDTVHRKEGGAKLFISDDYLSIRDKSDINGPTCLGADDTVGVWLMLELIRANIPALYIFHRAEEIGGLGSAYIADNTPELVEGIKFAVSLDRKGYTSIITEQYYDTASDEFALSLACMLGEAIPFVKDTFGTFTDSANYSHSIPECTNLSVGYFDQHTKNEKLDLRFAVMLRDLLLEKWDESKLIVSRDHSQAQLPLLGTSTPTNPYEPTHQYGGNYGVYGYGHVSTATGGARGSRSKQRKKAVDRRKNNKGGQAKSQDDFRDFLDTEDHLTLITAMVRNNADVIAQMLSDQGYDSYDLAEVIYEETGIMPNELPVL